LKTNRVASLALSFAVMTAGAIAYAADWHLVGDVVYENSDGSWSGWLSDGEGNHVEVRAETKKKAKAAADGAEQALEQNGCVDPCVFRPENCGGQLARLQTSEGGFEVVAVAQNAAGFFVAHVRDDSHQGVSVTRATPAGAQAAGQTFADGLNDGQCVAF
jgi:hypothetical protein